MKLASWFDRFLAWFVDVVLVNLAINFLPYPILWSTYIFPFRASVLFIYWAVLEGREGQSLGMKVLGIKTVNLKGRKITYYQALVESLGKSFFLPVDIIGAFVFKKRQRLFNWLSDTLVIMV